MTQIVSHSNLTINKCRCKSSKTVKLLTLSRAHSQIRDRTSCTCRSMQLSSVAHFLLPCRRRTTSTTRLSPTYRLDSPILQRGKAPGHVTLCRCHQLLDRHRDHCPMAHKHSCNLEQAPTMPFGKSSTAGLQIRWVTSVAVPIKESQVYRIHNKCQVKGLLILSRPIRWPTVDLLVW